MSLHICRNRIGKTRQPQQSRHNIRRRKHQIIQTGLNLVGEANQERHIHRLGERRILRIVRVLATHSLTMVGREDYDCVFIQSQFFQRIEYLPESTVNTCNGSEIVTYTLCLFHFRIGIGANQQAVQRLILV